MLQYNVLTNGVATGVLGVPGSGDLGVGVGAWGVAREIGSGVMESGVRVSAIEHWEGVSHGLGDLAGVFSGSLCLVCSSSPLHC